jgi:putative tricarboxylic transport membrane protein
MLELGSAHALCNNACIRAAARLLFKAIKRYNTKTVMPAQVRIYTEVQVPMPMRTRLWIPACAGMTVRWFVMACFLSINASAADWKPEKSIEIVVNTPPGNGPDRTARVMQSILQDKKQIDVPVTIANKLGGGGAVAYSYLNTRPGDGHTLMIASKALLTNHIAGRGPSYNEFTPIARLFTEYMIITVKFDSPIQGGKDLIERVKKNPAGVSFGIATSLGNPIHQSIAAPLRAEGVDIKSLKNVIFTAGSASLAAMMGGHVDVVPVTGVLAAQLAAAKQVRLLAASSPKRLPGVLAEVPTWRELGYDAVVAQWRGVVGPKGMSEAQITYWERTLKRMTEADEWKHDLDKNFWNADFIGAQAMRQFMDRDNAVLKVFLGELGLIK